MPISKINKIGSYPDYTNDIAIELPAWELYKYKTGANNTYQIPLSFIKPGLYYVQVYINNKEIKSPRKTKHKGQDKSQWHCYIRKKIDMSFYKSIAPFYNEIFPFSPAQLPFTTAAFSKPETCNLLDIGCGTGILSLQSAKKFKQVTAIDLDQNMLDKAIKSKPLQQNNLSYQVLNMLEITPHFNPESFDGVLCYGNTLVHLQDAETISHFLEKVHAVLKPKGKFLLQIINYDRIYEQQIGGLPTIRKRAHKIR